MIITMTRKDVLDYAQMRIFEAGVTGPFTSIGDAWAAAKTQYTEDHPDAMIKLLLGDLVRKQAAAESQGGPDVCSGPSRARPGLDRRSRDRRPALVHRR